jgi:lipopolysaccharide export LptBFGC system permease protein LptF
MDKNLQKRLKRRLSLIFMCMFLCFSAHAQTFKYHRKSNKLLIVASPYQE